MFFCYLRVFAQNAHFIRKENKTGFVFVQNLRRDLNEHLAVALGWVCFTASTPHWSHSQLMSIRCPALPPDKLPPGKLPPDKVPPGKRLQNPSPHRGCYIWGKIRNFDCLQKHWPTARQSVTGKCSQMSWKIPYRPTMQCLAECLYKCD